MKSSGRLDWSRISNDEAFHELIDALFCVGPGFPDYIPGDPTGGRDRGWDGMISNGRIPFVDGCPRWRWMIQAKFTRKNFAEAIVQLRTLLQGAKGKKGEMAKAVCAGATHLALFTQATLAAGQVDALEALATGAGLQQVIRFSRTRLEPLLIGKRWLRFRFFGDPQRPALRPVDKVDAREESLPVVDLPFVGREEEISDVRKNVLDGRQVVLLSGKGGAGKSRLVREIALWGEVDLIGYQGFLYRPVPQMLRTYLGPNARAHGRTPSVVRTAGLRSSHSDLLSILAEERAAL